MVLPLLLAKEAVPVRFNLLDLQYQARLNGWRIAVGGFGAEGSPQLDRTVTGKLLRMMLS